MARALYRTYRPKNLTEFLGQESIFEAIKNAAIADAIGHAYLFYGPRGTGKTTAARLIAKIANCEKRQNDLEFRTLGEPCNVCRPCREIDAGTALDVIEIDAASNRGIDEIRGLKEGIRLSPTSYKYKTFIIDEAHQLTKEASNALLKTLEEPPKHAIFILATTEFEKLLPTITSRAQRFNFKRPSLAVILQKLKFIVKAEKVSVDEKILKLIARSAEGSFRDAESILEQVISFGADRTPEQIESMLGKVGLDRTAALAEHIFKKDLQSALKNLEVAQATGINVVQMTKDLIHYMRRVLALHCDASLATLFAQELTEDEMEMMQKQAKMILDVKNVAAIMKALIKAYGEMRYSPFMMVPLQVALIEHLHSDNGANAK